MEIKSSIYELDCPGSLSVRSEILRSSDLSDAQILAKTLYTAVSSGTEASAYRGDPHLRPGVTYPRLIGYCNVAEVQAVGNEVNNLNPGDIVLTAQSHRSAFITESVNVILKISKKDDAKLATLTYLFHLGYVALLKAGVTPGMSVAVVGMGLLGLTTHAVATMAGCKTYMFSDQHENEVHSKFSILRVYSKNENTLNEGVLNGGADIVVLTSNAWGDWKFSMQCARKGGTISMLGFPGRGESLPDFNPLSSMYFYAKQLTLVASGFAPNHDVPASDLRFTLKRNCEYLYDSICGGLLPAQELISKVVSWQELGSIYDELVGKNRTIITGVLDWQGS